MQKINLIVLVLGLLVITGCKDPFQMDLRTTDQSLLVVEGFLNKGATTTFHLSRTMNLSDQGSLKPELQAMLSVEGKDNAMAYFVERGNGVYEADLAFLQVDKEYRLRIHTRDGKEYLSDYVAVKNNPPIDSISWRQEGNNDVRIYTSTHDPNNNTRYYRWEYDETWEIRSTFVSRWKRGSTSFVRRTFPEDDVSICWKYGASKSILLGSSAQLTSDVIKESPLLRIPRTSDKLEHRYSILVRQYALSKDAYEYFQIMKKNTESLGSIFAPQPSEVRGNIYSVSNPNEQVIGFVTASAVQQKRLFISRQELAGRVHFPYCEFIHIPDHPDSIKMYMGYLPIDEEYNQGNRGWSASFPECVDCTTRGGSTTKPSYW